MTAGTDVRLARVQSWPVLLLAAPAFVAIWSGWVGLGSLTGFGVIHPLPGIWDGLTLNTAITLPVGVEAYAAYALRVWLAGGAGPRAATFARRSAIGSLILGAGGQVAYHLMAAAGVRSAPWQITAMVACLPVAVLGMGAALAHLVAHDQAAEHVAVPQLEEMPAAGVPVRETAPQASEPRPSPAVPAPAAPADPPAAPVPAPVRTPVRTPAPRPPADVDDLLLVGQAVAVELAHAGQPLTRAALVAALRERGHPIGTEKARELLAALRAA